MVLRQSPDSIASLAGSLSESFADRTMWPMLAQRLTQITPPAVTPDTLWQRVEAAWFAVPQEHIPKSL
ncbi:hypothetical protein TNCV_680791 [Trichonephila clavipes]|nr:hypothetical protein TNCV_680791 [Trichonephila clavipes]